MRVHILSDLHLEFRTFDWLPVDADVVLLAGDVHVGTAGIDWILKTIQDRPVIYVLGNHEFYGHQIPGLIDEIKDRARGTNVSVLENDAIEIGEVTFLGATLWTNFQLYGDGVLGEVAAEAGMVDFFRIQLSQESRRFRPHDAGRFHAASCAFLEQQAQRGQVRKLAIVTHHAPSAQSIHPRYRGNALSPAFASNLEPLIKASGAKLWVHGHVHDHRDYVVGQTRVIANPRGYPSESHTGFDPSLVVEI